MLPIIGLILIILLTVILKLYYSSIYFSNILFLWLFIYGIFTLFKKYILGFVLEICSKLDNFYNNNLKHHINKRNMAILILLTSLLAGFTDTYYLGGDDTKLFYLYPKDYLINFASSIYPANSVSAMVGFLPSTSVYYLSVFLVILKSVLPFINLQSFLYTANLLFGVFFFYLMLDYVIKENVNYKKWILIICSFFYVFSIFNIYIFYNARLITIYLVSIFPLSIYLFLKSVKENKLYPIFIIAIVWSVFCVISVAAFWFLASAMVVFPLMMFLLKNNKLLSLKHFTVLGLLLFFINLFWISLLPYTTLFDKSEVITNSVLSQQFLKESSDGLRGNAEINELFYPLNNLFHFKIQDNYQWPYLPVFNDWYLKLIPLGSVFILVITTAGIIRKNNYLGRFYNMTLIVLLLAIYFFTLNMGNTKAGNWGVELFVWLSNNIPGFVAFRNMYDKFSFVLAFTYAFSLAISLAILTKIIKSESVSQKLLLGIFIIAALFSYPFLTGRLRKLPVWKTQNTFYTTSGFNQDYLDLTEYIKKQEYSGRYLTLPLTRGNISFIQDSKLQNHYYVGVSPLLLMTGKNDYSGSLSFGVYEQEIAKNLISRDCDGLGKVLQKTNTKYVITNNTISPDLQESYLLRDGIYDAQDGEFMYHIVGEKVRDFGERYSIYKINPNFENRKIFVESENQQKELKVTNFSKLSDTEYEIQINNIESTESLVFLEPYLPGWELFKDNVKIPAKNTRYEKWANSWLIDSKTIENLRRENNGPIVLKLVFTPRYNYSVMFLISISTFLLSITYVILEIRKYIAISLRRPNH